MRFQHSSVLDLRTACVPNSSGPAKHTPHYSKRIHRLLSYRRRRPRPPYTRALAVARPGKSCEIRGFLFHWVKRMEKKHALHKRKRIYGVHSQLQNSLLLESLLEAWAPDSGSVGWQRPSSHSPLYN